MKNFLRNCIPLLLLAALSLSAAALRPGDVAGQVLATEIRAFIDGVEIPAYNIDGNLGVVAEDLNAYGFVTGYDDPTRTLTVARTGAAVRGVEIPESSHQPSGTVIARVLYSDIRVYLDGREIPGYNIDGRTIILFSSLDTYGRRTYLHGAALSMLQTGEAKAPAAPVTLPDRVVHGGGAIDGYAGSNSLEAINAAYEAGHRTLELDFLLSADGYPVCLHDWSMYYSNDITDGVPMTLEAFRAVRIYERYTPLDLETLAGWLTAHPDVQIVTDVKDNNLGVLRTIAKSHPELQARFIPQIYAYDEYAPVRAMGYTNIILTLYRLGEYNDKVNTEKIVPFAAARGLVAVTADVTIASEEFIAAFNEAGVPLAVHTVNGEAEQAALFSAGIGTIYTDRVK